MSFEIRNICLNTYDINNSPIGSIYALDIVSNSNGTIGEYFNYMTWNNVNLRTMLGDTYFNKYSTFSIKLVQCLIGDLIYDDSIILSTNETAVEFRLEGLSFKNYNSTPYSITNINTITSVTIYTGSMSQLPSMSNLSTTVSGTKINTFNDKQQSYLFKKPTTDTVNLTIRRYKPTTQQYSNTLGYGHFKFIFEICGIQ
jgi:hypothetical protein